MTEQEKMLMPDQAYPVPEGKYQIGNSLQKNEETTQYGLWVARDRNGQLVLFTDEPIKDEAMGVWDNFSPDGSIVLSDKSKFPEVTWESEPKKVNMTLWA